MNRAALVALAPSTEELHGLAPPAQLEAAAKQIRATISAIEEDGREPDEWEAAKISDACNAMAHGMWFLAISECVLAVEAPEARLLQPTPLHQMPTTLGELRALELRCYQLAPRQQ